MDYDLGIQVTSWDHFDEVKRALLQSGEFEEVENNPHRWLHNQSTQLDILPFGSIESSDGKITWPDKSLLTMSMLGFQEAYEASISFRIVNKPIIELRVCTIHGLVILKLIAWEEREKGRDRDAARIATGRTKNRIIEILQKETRENSSYKLLSDMHDNLHIEDSSPQDTLNILKSLLQGVGEMRRTDQ